MVAVCGRSDTTGVCAWADRGTKEMTNRCLIYLRTVSLEVRGLPTGFGFRPHGIYIDNATQVCLLLVFVCM